jgi:uncharacterized membrane protein YfcA
VQLLVIAVVAFLTSGLTLFSGFGLGTLLLPAFLLFFPADISVAMTAIVHFANNLFKLALLGQHANRAVVLRFGMPAIVAAFLGAHVLLTFSASEPLTSYSLLNNTFQITAVKLVMGALIVLFALLEAVPSLRQFEFDKKYLPLGGALSGFFGGLSGHQGALRSAFLVRAGLSKESFIATGVVIACLVDVTRLGIYVQHFAVGGIRENLLLIVGATLSAFAGAFVGSRLLKKTTWATLHAIVTVLLLMIGALLCLGIV